MFLLITGLFAYFLFLVSTKYEFASWSEISLNNLQIPILVIAAFLLYLFWIGRYLGRLPQIISGEGSIEYFCWTFFIYRVQFLNSLGIVPIYFSKSFLRYFKNRMILNKKDSIKDLIIDKENCCICKNQNREWPVNYEFQTETICQEHFDSYYDKEFKFNKFLDEDYTVHQIVKSKCYYG